MALTSLLAQRLGCGNSDAASANFGGHCFSFTGVLPVLEAVGVDVSGDVFAGGAHGEPGAVAARNPGLAAQRGARLTRDHRPGDGFGPANHIVGEPVVVAVTVGGPR